MKQFALATLLMLGLALIGCGSYSHPASINGTWNASLLGSSNATIFTFTTSLTATGNGSLTVSNFQFSSNSPCFTTASAESGSFTLSGNYNGNVNGTFGFTVQSGTPAGNTLTMSGTANGNTIAGSWSISGSNCTGSGTFTMTKM